MAPNLTLYRANGSCSLAPHILLRELSIPFTSVLMSFGPSGAHPTDGSLTTAQYRERVHPDGKVPALRIEENGTTNTLIENPAILTYIASLAPARNIFGATDLERGQVYSWLCWLSGSLHGRGYAMVLRPTLFADDERQHHATVEKGREVVRACYERIEGCLVDGNVLVGSELSAADIHLYIFWRWGTRFGVEMGKAYPKYGRFVKAL